MKTLSSVLIKAREDKNLTVDQVAYETNISCRFIEALEAEDFSAFPAEAYLLGFLKNYAEFLDLDAEHVKDIYKNCLLREEPSPLSELMGKNPRFKFRPWMAIVPAVACALIFGVPPLVSVVQEKIESRKEALREAQKINFSTFDVETGKSEIRVKKNDLVRFRAGDRSLELTVASITPDSNDLKLSWKEGETSSERLVKLAKEEVLEFEQENTVTRLSVLLKDLGFSDDSAVLTLDHSVTEKTVEEVIPAAEMQPEEATTSKKGSRVVFIQKRVEPYSLRVQFQGDVLFRYRLRHREMVENFYKTGDTFNIDVARDIQIWTSNAGLTKMKVNGEDVIIGKAGSVQVFDLNWIKDIEKDEYRLEFSTAY